MKSIPVEQLDKRLAEALNGSEREEAVLLTENSKAMGVLVRLPEEFRDTGADIVVRKDQPGGTVLLIVQGKCQPSTASSVTGRPVFGSGRGMLNVLSEDDDHLKDFDEYMR